MADVDASKMGEKHVYKSKDSSQTYLSTAVREQDPLVPKT